MVRETRDQVDWNVLTSPWLDVVGLNATASTSSPLDTLKSASSLRCIVAGSPLDLFAAHRYLLTLLYWKADAAGGLSTMRGALLKGELPQAIVQAIEDESHRFWLFDEEAPFLQDPSIRDKKPKSAGSLFSEIASGSNVSHFFHSEDRNVRLCANCVAVGLLRLVPWSQSGGRGFSPSVHNAPPIVTMAEGENLAITLGLNLVPLGGNAGTARWTGHFTPSNPKWPVPYLEAMTWNPRRIFLSRADTQGVCWRCGRFGVAVVGPIVYEKNDSTKKRADKKDFEWNEPAAFYGPAKPYTPMKSTDEAHASNGADLKWLESVESAPKSAVIESNPGHRGWRLIVPSTNPANNKTFDHRQMVMESVSVDAIKAELRVTKSARPRDTLDGWQQPKRDYAALGAERFVRTAVKLLAPTDWLDLSSAAYREIHESAAAFDVLSGLMWPLRGKVNWLPSRQAAWLTLKVMAAVPVRARTLQSNAPFDPLRLLPKRQPDERRNGRTVSSPYPVAFPRGRRLEAELRVSLDKNMRRRKPEAVDWTSLCYGLSQLMD